jgi:hypothetical protein
MNVPAQRSAAGSFNPHEEKNNKIRLFWDTSEAGDRRNVPQFFDEWKLVNVPVHPQSFPVSSRTDLRRIQK